MKSCYRDILKTIELKLEYIPDLREKVLMLVCKKFPTHPLLKKKQDNSRVTNYKTL